MIEEKNLAEFNRKLTDFYNTNDYNKIDDFLYSECIYGLTFNLDLKEKNISAKH